MNRPGTDPVRGPTGPSGGAVRDRDVVIVLAAVVGLVLLVMAVSAFVGGLQEVLDRTPVLVVILVVGTLLVLWRAIARR